MRSQIGAVTTYPNVNGTSTTIPFAARAVKRGSLLIAMGLYDGFGATFSASDNGGGVWKIAKQNTYAGGAATTSCIAYCWNHPGGSSVSVTFTLSALRGYRSGALVEMSGPDLEDPYLGYTLAGGTTSIIPPWAQARPGSDSFGVGSTYNTLAGVSVSAGVLSMFQSTYGLFTRQPMPAGTGRHYASFTNAGTNSTTSQIVASFRGPYQPRRRVIESASAGVSLPTLSASTYVPGSITSTGWRPRVTATY